MAAVQEYGFLIEEGAWFESPSGQQVRIRSVSGESVTWTAFSPDSPRTSTHTSSVYELLRMLLDVGFSEITEPEVAAGAKDHLDTGFVYAPYIPLYDTPQVILDDFEATRSRKGLRTHYAKTPLDQSFFVKKSLT